MGEEPVYTYEDVISMGLHKALFVEGPENIQTSGLTIWKHNLYTVSDGAVETIVKNKIYLS